MIVLTILLFPLGVVFGVALVLFVFQAKHRVDEGLPPVGRPTARKLPESPDSEIALRRRLRQAAISRGAEEIMARAAANGQIVGLEDAQGAAEAMLDQAGME